MAIGACHIGIKYALFTYNFLFLLTGAGVFAIGVWMLCDIQFSNLILGPNDLLSEDKEAYLLISVGIAVVIISFFGCIGALAENRCLLVTFLVFMFVILSVLLTGGILIYVTTTSVKETVTSQLKSSVKRQDTHPASKTMVEFIQLKFNNCCREIYGTQRELSRPICTEEKHMKPCFTQVIDYYTKVLKLISGVAIAIAVVSLTGVVFSAILFLAVREQHEMKQRVSDEERNKLNEEQFPPSTDTTLAATQYLAEAEPTEA